MLSDIANNALNAYSKSLTLIGKTYPYGGNVILINGLSFLINLDNILPEDLTQVKARMQILKNWVNEEIKKDTTYSAAFWRHMAHLLSFDLN